MRITCKNFGQFENFSMYLNSQNFMDNGAGKTSLVNAYIWALTGRTINGFEARNVNAGENDMTVVTLEEMPFYIRPIQRVLHPDGGTSLHINGMTVSKSEFTQILHNYDVDIDLLVLCANPNYLTESSLTSEQLRSLLTKTGVMDNERATALRAEQKDVRAKLKQAETYAITNVKVPPFTVEPLNASEARLYREYEDKLKIVEKYQNGFSVNCEACGQPLGDASLKTLRESIEQAQDYVNEYGDEYYRINDQLATYLRENSERQAAQRAIDTARKARADVQTYDARLKEIENELMQADKEALSGALPKGMQIVTESTAKTSSKTKSVCTLTYNGIPLKSINHAKRVELCIDILDIARGQCRSIYPIILDNAERVQGLNWVENLYRLSVPSV